MLFNLAIGYSQILKLNESELIDRIPLKVVIPLYVKTNLDSTPRQVTEEVNGADNIGLSWKA